MSKKIFKYINKHPLVLVICSVVFCIIGGILICLFPVIVFKIITFCLLILMIIIMLTSMYEEKKEKQEIQNMNYEKKWKQYVDLVNEVIDEKQYGRNSIDSDWINRFNELIYSIATNEYLLRRRFNDFDIAACLIYSLTYYNDSSRNILLAFECAKRIFNEPKDYIRDLGFGYKLELEAERTFPKADINLPNDCITSEALISILRSYLIQNTEIGVIQLSDFLHILYLNCK